MTSGHDKTLRLWEKTQEPLVLDDEREIEREKEEEEQLATGKEHQYKTSCIFIACFSQKISFSSKDVVKTEELIC